MTSMKRSGDSVSRARNSDKLLSVGPSLTRDRPETTQPPPKRLRRSIVTKATIDGNSNSKGRPVFLASASASSTSHSDECPWSTRSSWASHASVSIVNGRMDASGRVSIRVSGVSHASICFSVHMSHDTTTGIASATHRPRSFCESLALRLNSHRSSIFSLNGFVAVSSRSCGDT